MEEKLELEDHLSPLSLLGYQNCNLKLLEKSLDVNIYHRGSMITIEGQKEKVKDATSVLRQLYQLSKNNQFISEEEVMSLLDHVCNKSFSESQKISSIKVSSANKYVQLKTYQQKKYFDTILKNDITYSIGPAGTGKTYVAVAIALNSLLEGSVKKVILTRPVVEAGESLGFLPGTLEDKVNPYLRPLMDAIYDMLTIEDLMKYKDRGQIEVAPLAYMRGRTLNNAFIILDEAQNTSIQQMKMFLTRLGHHSKAIITGDITQKDLPSNQPSGVDITLNILKNIQGVSFIFFDKKDVVRHPIVVKIIEAFERYEKEK